MLNYVSGGNLFSSVCGLGGHFSDNKMKHLPRLLTMWPCLACRIPLLESTVIENTYSGISTKGRHLRFLNYTKRIYNMHQEWELRFVFPKINRSGMYVETTIRDNRPQSNRNSSLRETFDQSHTSRNITQNHTTSRNKFQQGGRIDTILMFLAIVLL